jgi:hypothetical protein
MNSVKVLMGYGRKSSEPSPACRCPIERIQEQDPCELRGGSQELLSTQKQDYVGSWLAGTSGRTEEGLVMEFTQKQLLEAVRVGLAKLK